MDEPSPQLSEAQEEALTLAAKDVSESDERSATVLEAEKDSLTLVTKDEKGSDGISASETQDDGLSLVANDVSERTRTSELEESETPLTRGTQDVQLSAETTMLAAVAVKSANDISGARDFDSVLDQIEQKNISSKKRSVVLQLGVLVLLIVVSLIVVSPATIGLPDFNSPFGMQLFGYEVTGLFFVILFLAIVFASARMHLLLQVASWILIPVGLVASLFSKDIANVTWWLPSEMFEQSGHYKQAAWLWRLGVSRAAGEEDSRARVLAYVSVNLVKSGDCIEARKRAEEAVKNGEIIDKKDDYFKNIYSNCITALHALATVEEFEGNHLQVNDVMEKALDLINRRGLDYPEMLLRCYGALGNAAVMRGDFLNAAAWFSKAETLFDAKSAKLAPECISKYLVYRGIFEHQKNQYSAAMECFRQSLEASLRLRNPSLSAEAYLWLARVYRRTGDLDLTEKYYKKAIHYCGSAFESHDCNAVSIQNEIREFQEQNTKIQGNLTAAEPDVSNDVQ